MAVEDGFGVTETARRLSISLKILANCVAQYRLDKQGFALKPGVSEQDAELARLKKENALLRMECDILKKSGGVLCQSVAVRYAAVSALRHRYSVRFVCLVLHVSASGYYAWLKRDAAPPSRTTHLEAEVLLPTKEHAAHMARSDCTGNKWQVVAPSAFGRSSS